VASFVDCIKALRNFSPNSPALAAAIAILFRQSSTAFATASCQASLSQLFWQVFA